MECSNFGETYPAETITLGFDITGCVLYRELRVKSSGVIIKSWQSPDTITIDDASNGVYTIPKWTIDIPVTTYIGEDRIQYANGDVQDLWNLTLEINR